VRLAAWSRHGRAGDVANEHIRFPFWDFETPRDNNSSFFVDTAFSF